MMPPSLAGASRPCGGQRVEEQWYRATVVAFMPRARDHIMHFDDGHVERVSLPTDLSSLRLLDERVECCSCERCCCDGGAGQPLPLAVHAVGPIGGASASTASPDPH